MAGDDGLDLSRREFMQVGTTSLLAIQPGGLQQVDPGGQAGEEYQFQGVADLMGPANAKPAAGSDFFDDRGYYAYRYQETDGDQFEWFITQDDSGWTNLSIMLQDYATPFQALKTAQQFTQFALDPSKDITRRRYGWYSNNTLFDLTHISNNDANGTITMSTGATGTDTVRLRSALAGQYISQALAQPGVGLDIADANVTIDADGLASLSHGTVAVGAGWHDGSSGGWGVGGPVQTFLGLRFASDGAYAELISNGGRIGGSPVAQQDWNLDTMDGSGDSNNPSGYTLHPENGYIYNTPYTWYGYGALYVGVIHPQADEPVFLHKFAVDQTSFDRPNIPPIVIVDNGGTASSLSLEVGGMQYALYGSQLSEEPGEERATAVTRTGFSVGTAAVDANNGVDPVAEPGDPVIAFQRESDVRDLAVRLDGIVAQTDAPVWVFSWDEYEPATALTGANFRNPNEPINPGSESKVVVDTAATDYTPTTAVSRGVDYVYTDKNQDSLEALNTDDRIPIDAARVITAAHDGATATIDPAQVRIVEGY